jgi:hypothetical protein
MDKKAIMEDIADYLGERYFDTGVSVAVEHGDKYSAIFLGVRDNDKVTEYVLTITEDKPN